MYVCMYVCIHIHIYVYNYMYVYKYIYICMYVCGCLIVLYIEKLALKEYLKFHICMKSV